MDFLKALRSTSSGLSENGTKWRGFYEQGAQEFPIEAILQLSESKVVGSMKDLNRERRFHLAEYARLFSMNEEEERQYVLQIAARFRNPPPEDISVVEILPERSRLLGAIVEQEVYFQKTYESPTILRIQHGRRRGQSRQAPQPVHYEGTLSLDRSTIAGVWTIEGSANEVLAEGRFELVRD